MSLKEQSQNSGEVNSLSVSDALESEPFEPDFPEEFSPKISQRAKINPNSLRPSDILQLQRTIGNRAVVKLLGKKSSQKPGTIQRQLNPGDEGLFRQFVQEKVGGPLDPTLQKKVDNLVKFCTSLADAKKTFNQLQITDFSAVQGKADSAPNSLNSWLGPQDTLIGATKYVNVSDYDKAGSSGSGFILWTCSVQGCLGVAAIGNGSAFLAHWDPEQIKNQEDIQKRIQIMEKFVGTASQIHLSTKAINAPYVTSFVQEIANTQHQIASQNTEDRLAVNAKNGQMMYNFKIDELSKK